MAVLRQRGQTKYRMVTYFPFLTRQKRKSQVMYKWVPIYSHIIAPLNL